MDREQEMTNEANFPRNLLEIMTMAVGSHDTSAPPARNGPRGPEREKVTNEANFFRKRLQTMTNGMLPHTQWLRRASRTAKTASEKKKIIFRNLLKMMTSYSILVIK